jgi:hypothetical protein
MKRLAQWRRQWLREWRILTARQGHLPAALLLAVGLAGAQLILPEYDADQAAADKLVQRQAFLDDAQSWQQRLPQLDTALVTAQTAYSGSQSRLVKVDSEDPATSAARLSKALQTWLDAHGGGSIRSITPQPEVNPERLRADIHATLSVKQLAALLAARRTAPIALQLVTLRIEPNDLKHPDSVRVQLGVDALLALPTPAEAPADPKARPSAAAAPSRPTGGTTPSSGSRTILRGTASSSQEVHKK